MKALDKAIKACDARKVALPEISDVWRLIDKYDLKYQKVGNKIIIDVDEAKSKGVKEDYIKKLSGLSKMYGKGDF